MPYIQRNVPSPNKIYNFSLRDFSGGLNNRSEQMQDNECTDILNMKFADEIIFETRDGQKYYNDKTYTNPVSFLDMYKPYNDEDIEVVATSSKIYFGNREFSINGQVSGVNYFGKYYFCDGNKIRVYGKFDDEASTYVKLTGTPITTYEIYEVVNPPTDFTPLGTEHIKGVKNIDYTNKKVWYEPCKFEMEDTLKGSNVLPQNVKYIVSHTGRLFASGNDKDDDNVFITDLQNPLYFPVGLPLQIPPSSDKITALVVFDDSVILGRERDIYKIQGDTNNNQVGVTMFSLKRLNSHTGIATHQACDIAHNYLIFLGVDGNVYAIQSANTYERDLSTRILSQTVDLFKSPVDLTYDDLSSATSVFCNDEWLLSIKDKVLVYSYRHMSWTMYNNLNARSFYNLYNELIWGNDNGRICTWDKEINLDLGEPFQSKWFSKWFDMGRANSQKHFREFFLIAHTYEDYYSDIYVKFEIDYADVKDRIVISNKLSRWGISQWGDRFINTNINETVPIVVGRRGRNIRFKLSNSYFVREIVENVSDLDNVSAKADNLCIKVSSTNEYYIFFNKEWNLVKVGELNQKMKVYQINGDYELRGNR